MKLLFLFVLVLSMCPFGYTDNTTHRKQEINSNFCGRGREWFRSEGQIFALKGDPSFEVTKSELADPIPLSVY